MTSLIQLWILKWDMKLGKECGRRYLEVMEEAGEWMPSKHIAFMPGILKQWVLKKWENKSIQMYWHLKLLYSYFVKQNTMIIDENKKYIYV